MVNSIYFFKMIVEYSPVTQALLGTLLTWGLTAAGSALVFVFKSGHRKVLDGSLGFAAGVMLAASYWSLLAVAIEYAEESDLYGNHVWFPVAAGFCLGAAFVYLADVFMNYAGNQQNILVALSGNPKLTESSEELLPTTASQADPEQADGLKRRGGKSRTAEAGELSNDDSKMSNEQKLVSWKRILLLIIAITIHNIPEGLAVGVGFGAVGKAKTATFENARNLAIGIGIQNFPEGLAVSLPLRAAGVSTWKSFWYGQLSGMVEPIAGVIGALAVVVAEPLLPYALAFAAGAMVYVVNDDIIPEAQTFGNGKFASAMSIVGFTVMMVLEVALG